MTPNTLFIILFIFMIIVGIIYIISSLGASGEYQIYKEMKEKYADAYLKYQALLDSSVEKKEIIYVSGGITGVEGYLEKFQSAEDDLIEEGYQVINPAKTLDTLLTLTYEQYIQICYPMIDACSTIFMMKGWEMSIGAGQELRYAQQNNKKVIYQV